MDEASEDQWDMCNLSEDDTEPAKTLPNLNKQSTLPLVIRQDVRRSQPEGDLAIHNEQSQPFKPEIEEEEKQFDLISGSIEWSLDDFRAELAHNGSGIPFSQVTSKLSSDILSEQPGE